MIIVSFLVGIVITGITWFAIGFIKLVRAVKKSQAHEKAQLEERNKRNR